MNTSPSGLLLINKPPLWTSHDVVAKIRTLLPKNTKVGHTGTLDPLATGLLILLIGKEYTKKADEFLKLDKIYEATFQWCATSSTDDAEGEITKIENCKAPTIKEIEEILPLFTGKIEQIPPMYSAVKIEGKKLYEIARKGKIIHREPRNVEIYNMQILKNLPKISQTSFRIECSSGTYIRSITRDMGNTLNCGAYLSQLNRTNVGKYHVKNANNMDDITKENIQDKLLK